MRVEYVVLSAEALARQEPPSESELRAAYESRAGQFRVEEQRRASHILVKTKEEAEKLMGELKKNPGRFADLAKSIRRTRARRRRAATSAGSAAA